MDNLVEKTQEYIKGRFEWDEINDLLGRGSFGNVFKAKDKQRKGEIVAIKQIIKKFLNESPEKERQNRIDSINNEVNLLKICECPYCVKLFEAIKTESCYYLIMEYCDTDLDKYLIKKKSGLTISEIRKLFKKLNEVFKKMKEKGIIHRDLKPQNILIQFDHKKDNEIIPKLCDFGIGRALYNGQASTILLGTFGYMAPELMDDKNKNKIKYDEKADLWSIGVILYQLYYNELPTMGENARAILKELNRFILPPIKDDMDFYDLLEKLLQIEPEKRISFDEYIKHPFWIDKNDIEYIQLLLNDYNKNYKKNYNLNQEELLIRIDSGTTLKELEALSKIRFDNVKKLYIIIEDSALIKDIEWLKEFNIKNLKILNFNRKEIGKIETLNNVSFHDLSSLSLSGIHLNNLSFIKDLPFKQLKTLFLCDNQINNIESLRNMKLEKLSELYLGGNQINNLNSLAEVQFNNLEVLDLCYNQIKDISIFSNIPFKKLTKLELKGNLIEEIDSLVKSEMNKLKELNLESNNIKNLESLSQAPFINLQELNLERNEISDITVFTNVKFINLKTLNLENNKIDSISSLAQIKCNNLEKLLLNDNLISDISILEKLQFKNKIDFELNGNKISEISTLKSASLKKDDELSLYRNPLKNVDSLRDLTFKIYF